MDPAADGWTRLSRATGVSADGNTIVGYGTRNGYYQAFRAVVPSVIPNPLPGDFNNDGNVNAADYVTWRKTGGTQAHYNTWRAHFGESAGSGSAGSPLGASAAPLSSAVPKPANALLSLLGAIALLLLPVNSRKMRAQI